MEEVFFLERENRNYGIKISNERVILREGSRERTILIKSIDSFDVLDYKSSGVICIIFSILLFAVAVMFGLGPNNIYHDIVQIIIISSIILGLIFFIIGILYLTIWKLSLVVSAISGKIKFPVSSFGNNYEIQEAIRNAILYKPNGSEKLMNSPATSGENEPPKRLDAYGNATSKPLNKEITTAHNIPQELRSKYAAGMEPVDIAEWAAELKTRNATFETSVKECFDEIAAKTDIILKEARMQLDEAYQTIAERINALIISVQIAQPPQAERNEPPNRTKEITQSDYKVQELSKKEEKKADDWLLDSKVQKSNKKTDDWLL
jgi:hypothetical protein